MPKIVKANGKTFTFDDNVTNDQISSTIDEYFGVKKKEVSQPTSQKTPSVSKSKPTITPTSSDTEETQTPVASDGLGGTPKYRLAGEKQKPLTKEQEKKISDEMYSNTKPTVQKGKTAIERVYAMPKTGSATPPIQNIDARPFLEREESKPLNERIDNLEKDIFYAKQGSLDQANKVYELNQLKKQKEERNDNLYNSFLDANKNTDLDLEEANKEVEDKFNQVGFLNNTKSILKNTWNAVADVTGQGLSFGTEEKAPDAFRFETDEKKKYIDQANKEFYSAVDYYKNLKNTDSSVKIPEYDIEKINNRAKEIAVEESLAAKKQQRINSFMEDVDNKGLKDVLLDYNSKKYDTISDNDKKLLNITTANKLAYQKSASNLLNLVNQLKEYHDKGVDPPQEFVDSFKKENDLNNSLKNSYLKSQEEYSKKEKELGTLDENYDILKRDYGFWKNAYANTAAIGGESLRGLLGAANYLNELPFINAGSTTSRDNSIRDLSKTIGKDVEEIRGSVEKPVEAGDISSASDFGRWITNSVIIPTSSFMSKAAAGPIGITTLVSESLGNTHEGMLDQMDAGTANYSQAQLIGVPAAKAAIDGALFLFDASLLKNTQRAIKSATAGEKDLIAESVLKSITEKQLHGAAVMNGITIAKNAVDKFSGVDPNKNLLDGTGEATAVSIATVGMIDTAPKIVIGINSNFSLDGQALKISDNINKLQSTLDKTPLSDENRKIIVDQLDTAKKNLKDVLTKQVRNISSLSDSQYKEVVRLNITRSNIFENAKKIQSDSSLDQNTKAQIFEGLKQELSDIEQRRRDIIENGPKIQLEKLDPKLAEGLRSQAKYELEKEAKNKQIIIPENEIDKRAMVIHNEKTYKANDVIAEEAKPKGISHETSSNVANLTEDGKGNYVFYHISPTTLETIDPKMHGTNAGNVTSAPEKAAIGRAGGVSMYYTAETGTESMVKGNMHMVKVPEAEVYDFNSDPLNLVEEARKRFEKEYPNLPFTANDQFAQITKLANEKGYKMVVGEWQGKTRAQTTEPMTPIDVKEMNGDVVVKPFEEQYESNTDKGYKSIIPESKEAKLKAVYDEINTEKNRANEYDELYHLAGKDNSKTPQEDITKLIEEDKTLSQEVKDKYAEAISYEPEQRRTVSIVGEKVKVDNAPEGHHLNIGLLEGRTNKKMSAEDVLSKLPKDIKVISSTEIKGTEPSVSVEISRPLTSSEMNKFLADTKQQAIAQLSDKNGILYDAKRGTSEGWGEFNPELFVTQDGKNLTEVKATEVKPTIKSKLEAFKAKHIEKTVYDRTKLDTQVENAKKSLSKILPDIKFVLHENTESFVKESGKNGRGYYDPATKTIHINALEANARTVAHEVFHSVLLDKVKTDASARDLTKRMIDSISKTLEGNPELKKTLDDFVKNYDENIKSEEKMAELFGHLADGYEGFDAPTKSIIKRAMDRLAKMFGLKPFTEGEVVDMLKTLSGKVATGEEIVAKDIKAISEGASSYISEPSNIERFQKTNEQKVVVGDHKLSFVKKSDLIDIDSLMKDISDKKQKVWFWVADQLGRGNYFDSKIDGEHYLDAGPSFALDPINRDKNVIWASGKNEKEINNLIGKSDYIFIISGSPEKSKLFNKSIIDVVAKRAGDFDSFKKDVLESSKIKSINDILSSVNSWDELRDSTKRKEFLLAIQDQKDKNTPLKKTLENYNAIVDLNELRDGFYADNNFGLNDIMLVLKPTEFGGKSEHSTYENNILGEVVGVPDIKVNAFDIMPSDIKNKYKEDLGRSQQQQAVAPYGIGVKQIERFQESESYSDMKEIVKDMIDDGMSISEIKKTIGSELGSDQVSLAERAHDELTTQPKTTSIKNEVVSAEREAKGLTPVKQRDTYSTKVNYDETKAKVDSGEISPRDLAIAIIENPGKVAITSEVSDALAYDRMRLSNEYDKVVKAIVEDPTDQSNIIARDRLEKQIEDNDRASKYSGTISSHALLARKNVIKQDYSLDRLVMRYKAETGGKISEDMRAKFDVLSTKLQEATAKLEQYESKIADKQVAAEFEKIKRNADKEVRSNKRAAAKESLKVEREDLYKKLKEIQREQMSRLSSNPLPIEMVPVISKLAKNLVMDGVVTLDGVVDEIHSNVKDMFEDITKRDIRDALSGYGKFKLPTKDEVAAQLREIKSQAKLVSALEDAESGKMPLKTGFSRSKASETVTELRKKVQEAIKQNGISSENLPEEKVWKSPEEKALKALKTRLKNREKELQGMLDSGNFEKKPRNITALDSEATKLKADIERIKNKVDIEIKKERLKNRTKVEKATDFITTWRRNLLLTGVKVLGKLTSAAAQRTMISPIEEIAGGVLSKLPILSKVAEKAPREGGFNAKAEVKAISQWWKKATYEDMREIVKSGKGALDLLHGKKTDLPPSIFDFFGQMHQALKQPAKRNEYFRSFEKRLAHAQKNGVDISDPLVQATIGTQAYLDANRAIFMQENSVTTAYKAAINTLERAGDSGKVVAGMLKIILPIVKVPTNFANEITSYSVGGLKALLALRNGTKNLTPEQADYIMRNIKKQSLGAAFIALGYFNAAAIGGFYQRGEKRDENDVEAGGLRVLGVDMPKWMVHTPLLEMLQIGATLRRVQDDYENKEKEGTAASVLAVTKGVVEEVPFARAPEDALKALSSTDNFNKYFRDLGESMINPQLTKEMGLEVLPKKNKEEESSGSSTGVRK